jgi:hypothetical protein
MSKRRLGNLARAGDITAEFDRISGGDQNRIGWQTVRLDRHACWKMDDAAKPSGFRDVEIGARIIPSRHPSSPQPAQLSLILRPFARGVGHNDHDCVSPSTTQRDHGCNPQQGYQTLERRAAVLSRLGQLRKH